jgi:2-polyprenyl-3-methyl-5-hydroxy-6-metoxy-1,4-benzoquinol methylase
VINGRKTPRRCLSPGNTRRVPLEKNLTRQSTDVAGSALHDREAAFHDAWAGETDLSEILVRESFEAPTAMENQFILQRMGDLKGKRLLDIGAGLGESSVYFALQGAEVTTVDVSPRMVNTALDLGARFGVKLQGIVSGAEILEVSPASYDLIYIANTIHHVQNRAALFAQMQRALKPGGRFFSYDPLAYNPAINLYRRMASAVRTPDESPLSTADLDSARKYFRHVGHREFWLSSLLLFVKYYLIDRVHPNEDRYWKRILRETPLSLRWWVPLRALDKFLTRIPLVRWLAWNIVMWGEKGAD